MGKDDKSIHRLLQRCLFFLLPLLLAPTCTCTWRAAAMHLRLGDQGTLAVVAPSLLGLGLGLGGAPSTGPMGGQMPDRARRSGRSQCYLPGSRCMGRGGGLGPWRVRGYQNPPQGSPWQRTRSGPAIDLGGVCPFAGLRRARCRARGWDWDGTDGDGDGPEEGGPEGRSPGQGPE